MDTSGSSIAQILLSARLELQQPYHTPRTQYAPSFHRPQTPVSALRRKQATELYTLQPPTAQARQPPGVSTAGSVSSLSTTPTPPTSVLRNRPVSAHRPRSNGPIKAVSVGAAANALSAHQTSNKENRISAATVKRTAIDPSDADWTVATDSAEWQLVDAQSRPLSRKLAHQTGERFGSSHDAHTASTVTSGVPPSPQQPASPPAAGRPRSDSANSSKHHAKQHSQQQPFNQTTQQQNCLMPLMSQDSSACVADPPSALEPQSTDINELLSYWQQRVEICVEQPVDTDNSIASALLQLCTTILQSSAAATASQQCRLIGMIMRLPPHHHYNQLFDSACQHVADLSNHAANDHLLVEMTEVLIRRLACGTPQQQLCLLTAFYNLTLEAQTTQLQSYSGHVLVAASPALVSAVACLLLEPLSSSTVAVQTSLSALCRNISAACTPCQHDSIGDSAAVQPYYSDLVRGMCHRLDSALQSLEAVDATLEPLHGTAGRGTEEEGPATTPRGHASQELY